MNTYSYMEFGYLTVYLYFWSTVCVHISVDMYRAALISGSLSYPLNSLFFFLL